MHSHTTIAPLQQLAALAAAAVLTVGVLFSLAAQADTEHAAALASTQVQAKLACATPLRNARG